MHNKHRFFTIHTTNAHQLSINTLKPNDQTTKFPKQEKNY